MKLQLIRDTFKEEYTLGRLFIDGELFCYTVEDKVREGEKVYGLTAIPKGVYKVIINMSNRFKKEMPLLLDVKGFEGIRIHSGNTAADSLGCIIVGMIRTTIGVGQSRVAFERLMQKLKGQKDIVIEVK